MAAQPRSALLFDGLNGKTDPAGQARPRGYLERLSGFPGKPWEFAPGQRAPAGLADTHPKWMNLPMPIEFDDLVDEVMRGHPATIRVFLDFKMGCVGCPIATFHTVDDACGEHGIDREVFLTALRDVAGQAE